MEDCNLDRVAEELRLADLSVSLSERCNVKWADLMESQKKKYRFMARAAVVAYLKVCLSEIS